MLKQPLSEPMSVVEHIMRLTQPVIHHQRLFPNLRKVESTNSLMIKSYLV